MQYTVDDLKQISYIPDTGLVPWLLQYYKVQGSLRHSAKQRELRTKFLNHYPLCIIQRNCADWRTRFISWCKIPRGVTHRIQNIGNITNHAWPTLNLKDEKLIMSAWSKAHSYDFECFDGMPSDEKSVGLPIIDLCAYHTKCAGFDGNIKAAAFEQLTMASQLNKVYGRMEFRGKRFYYAVVIGQDIDTHAISIHAPDGTVLSTQQLLTIPPRRRDAFLNEFVGKFENAHEVVKLFIKRLFTGNIEEVQMILRYGLSPEAMEHIERFLLIGNTFDLMDYPALCINPVDPQFIKRAMNAVRIGRENIEEQRIPSSEFVIQINDGFTSKTLFDDRMNSIMKVACIEEMIWKPIATKFQGMLEKLHFLVTITDQETDGVEPLRWYQLKRNGSLKPMHYTLPDD